MVSNDSSNTLLIDGENNDKIKLDLSIGQKMKMIIINK